MGLFDTVTCEYPIPNPVHQDLEFQTKDLECLLDHYVITRDGRLIRRASEGRGLERDIEWPLHGDLRIYELDPEKGEGLVEYTVRFTHGRVEWIRRLKERGGAVTDEWAGGTSAASPPAPAPAARRRGEELAPTAADHPRHELLHGIVKKLPSDFEPYGQRSRDDDGGPDCSCGCRWFIPLEGDLGYDWGVCYNPGSPRCGLLTFEHQGCRQFEGEERR